MLWHGGGGQPAGNPNGESSVIHEDSGQVAAALGRLPSGCAILTATQGDQSSGILVSWVQQVAFEPPSLVVAIHKGRPIAQLMDGSNRFALNVLGEDPTVMFKHFGRGFALEEDAFAGLDTERSDYGPLLLDCIAQMGCAIMQKVGAGDHDLYIAHVQAASARNEATPYVHVRKSGSTY